MLIEALLGRGMGVRMRLNAVQPLELVGLGDGVEFNLNGGMWDSLSHAQIVRVMKGRW
jgi:hypothetical protein